MSDKVIYPTFGSLLEKVIDNRGRTCPTAESGLPLIATNCIVNCQLYPKYINVRYVDNETYLKWFRGHPLPGDMIFVLKGTPGRVAWVPEPVDFCIAQDMVAIRANVSKVYPKYLFAVLRSSTIQQQIEGLHVGSLIPHFKKGDFDELKIPLVDRQLQEFIGDHYFNISLKIDLLHHQNKTLESMAETLFRQWFVEQADDGWEKGKLGDVIEFTVDNRGKTAPTSDKGIPLIATNCIKNENIFPLYEKVRYVSLETYGNWFRAHPMPGDIIFVNKGTPGCINMVPEKVDFCIAQDMVALRANKNKISKYFLFFYLRSSEMQSHILNSSVGTTIPHLKKTDLLNFLIVIPDYLKSKEFDSLVAPFFSKMNYNCSQIRILIQLRDSLLPKLMSGEVRVAI